MARLNKMHGKTSQTVNKMHGKTSQTVNKMHSEASQTVNKMHGKATQLCFNKILSQTLNIKTDLSLKAVSYHKKNTIFSWKQQNILKKA